MKAGVCTRDMTFPELIGNPSVHDRLFAKVLVLDDGEETLCIICLDTVGPFFPEVRERIHGQLGIKHTLINCSHTRGRARLPRRRLGKAYEKVNLLSCGRSLCQLS